MVMVRDRLVLSLLDDANISQQWNKLEFVLYLRNILFDLSVQQLEFVERRW